MNIPKPLLEKIEKSESFLAHIHLSPDADTIGSALALKLAIESVGKVFEVFCEDEIPPFADFLANVDSVHQMPLNEALASFRHDYYLAMDTPILGLLTRAQPVPNFPKPLLIIDHHLETSVPGQVSWIDKGASSTAEMVYQLIKELKIEITPDIATCLLFGLLGDTGVFQNLNTNEKVFEVASDLMSLGGDYQQCVLNLNRSYPFKWLKSWAVLLEKIQLSDDGEFVWVAIDNETWQKCDPALKIQVFADIFTGRIAGTKFGAVLIEKKDNQVSGSLRSRLPDADVQKIAERLGGGGHKNSSGFRFQGSLQEAQREFLNAISLLKSKGEL